LLTISAVASDRDCKIRIGSSGLLIFSLQIGDMVKAVFVD
jgi:hypothetical protein